MTAALSQLSDIDLRSLKTAIETNRIAIPFSELQVARVISRQHVAEVMQSLDAFNRRGFSGPQIAIVIELLLNDRSSGVRVEPSVDLVTSGPEAPGITNRDTAVVVRELFRHAEQSVLLFGYAVYQGDEVFHTLAERMEERTSLKVRLFLNIARPDGDACPPEVLVSQFMQRFRDSQWPSGCRLPEVFYDPRSVAVNARSSLHAKCVVVDRRHVFVSSANFTRAGQERNIEVGLKLESQWLADQLTRHFQLLIENNLAQIAR
jgi:phosphatidylserine/phosphatidylglycerophosphate/cardiolipin synthase-like enzyme